MAVIDDFTFQSPGIFDHLLKSVHVAGDILPYVGFQLFLVGNQGIKRVAGFCDFENRSVDMTVVDTKALVNTLSYALDTLFGVGNRIGRIDDTGKVEIVWNGHQRCSAVSKHFVVVATLSV